MSDKLTLPDAMALKSILEVAQVNGNVGRIDEGPDGAPVVTTGYIRCLSNADGSRPGRDAEIRDLCLKVQTDPDDENALAYWPIREMMACAQVYAVDGDELPGFIEAVKREHVASQN